MKPPREIIDKETGETLMFACSGCGVCHTVKKHGDQARQQAEQCCIPTPCFSCSAPLPKDSYYEDCEACRDKARKQRFANEERERFEKAEKLETQPADVGMLYCWDQYFNDWDEIIDRCERPDQVPEYAWATETVSWTGIDIVDSLENDRNNYSVEDRELIDEVTDLQELRDFVAAWNAKQRVTWFEADLTRAVLRPADYCDRFPEDTKDEAAA